MHTMLGSMHTEDELISYLSTLPPPMDLSGFARQITPCLNESLEKAVQSTYQAFTEAELKTFLLEHLVLSDAFPVQSKAKQVKQSCLDKDALMALIDKAYKLKETLLISNESLNDLITQCLYVTEELYGKAHGHSGLIYQLYIDLLKARNYLFYNLADLKQFTSSDKLITDFCVEHRITLIKKNNPENLFGVTRKNRTVIDDLYVENLFPTRRALKLLIKRFLFEHLPPEDLNYFELVHQHVNALELDDIGEEILSLTSKVQASREQFDIVKALVETHFHIGFQDVDTLVNFIHSVAITTGHLQKVKRSFVSEMCDQRYLSLNWIRQHDLYETISGQKILLRRKGARENSRIRICDMPYKPYHGLSLSSSGLREDYQSEKFSFEWNLPQDVNAFLHNQFPDVEKLIHDALALNPKVARKKLALNERFFTVMQNALYNSSQPDTQHMHIYAATIHNFPYYQTALKNRIKDDWLLLQGTKKDAVALCVKADSDALNKYIKTLDAIRLGLEDTYRDKGGVHMTQYVIPDTQGTFIYLLIPHVALQRGQIKEYLNPVTGEEIDFPGYVEYYPEFDYKVSDLSIDRWLAFNDAVCPGGLREVLEKLIAQYKKV